jgi:SAM-dependent methyltransferase
MIETYDYDYFERGIETGKSLYTNYRWIPELTIPLAMTFIDVLALTRHDKILDFGCAKGYVVKALRILYRETWGCDISDYAVGCADCDVKPYIKLSYEDKAIPFIRRFDWIIAKDILEHITYEGLPHILDELSEFAPHMFAVIPLGKDGKYNAPAYNLDITHKITEDLNWWVDKFLKSGWACEMATHRVSGIKDNWANFDLGNGFFILRNCNA